MMPAPVRRHSRRLHAACASSLPFRLLDARDPPPDAPPLVRPLAAFALLSLCALPACGARTGIPEPLVRSDASTLDAGPRDSGPPRDAFRPDTGFDSPPPCRVDSDCDDGVACTHDR